MKKLLIVLLTLILILGAIFIWKGGHHALFLTNALQAWSETTDTDHSLTVRIDQPSISAQAETFRRKYQDRPMVGLTAEGCTVYLLDGNLYMDTGKAYALPEIDPDGMLRKKLLTGLLLHGRVTKTDNVYCVSMETEALSLSLSVVLEDTVSSMTLDTEFSFDGAPVHLLATLTAKETEAHPLPQPVLDAIVLSQMEQPMALQEILDALQPVIDHLEDTEAGFLFSAECGILKVSNEGVLRRMDNSLILQFGERELPLDILPELSSLSSVSASMMLLRSADFSRTDTGVCFRIPIAPDDVAGFCQSLVPEFVELSITFHTSQIIISISDDALESICFRVEGTVPLLLAEIPVVVSAEIIPQ